MAPLVGDPEVAKALWRAVQSQGATKIEIIALYEAAIVESGMRNLNYGDRDSLGVLQQRAPWGSVESRMNPEESAVRFLQKAAKFRPWSGTPGSLAQKVQVSAFPLRYDAMSVPALAWIAFVSGSEKIDDVTGPIKDAVGGVGDVVKFVTSSDGLRRISMFVAGIILVIAGVGVLFSKQIMGKVEEVLK